MAYYNQPKAVTPQSFLRDRTDKAIQVLNDRRNTQQDTAFKKLKKDSGFDKMAEKLRAIWCGVVGGSAAGMLYETHFGYNIPEAGSPLQVAYDAINKQINKQIENIEKAYEATSLRVSLGKNATEKIVMLNDFAATLNEIVKEK